MLGRRNERPPKQKEKRRECYRCGCRTTHVFDHGLNQFICSECELGQGNDLQETRTR